MLKLEVCLAQVNREKISIYYNECYKRGSVAVEIFIDGFGAIMYMQFLIDIMQMLPNSSVADVKTISNFFIQ